MVVKLVQHDLFRPDDDLFNADWPKRTRDLPPEKSDEWRMWLALWGTTQKDYDQLHAQQMGKGGDDMRP